jgi:hypothetical protein
MIIFLNFSKIVLLVFFMFTLHSGAQVGIGTTDPDPSAALDISSTEKGVLLPRMTQAERNAIPSPAVGLLVYQTDNLRGFYYRSGAIWYPLSYRDYKWRFQDGNMYSYDHLQNVGIGVDENSFETDLLGKVEIKSRNGWSLSTKDAVDNVYLEDDSRPAGLGEVGGSIAFSGPENWHSFAGEPADHRRSRRGAVIAGVQTSPGKTTVGLSFLTAAGTQLTESMLIDHNGNVGINTSSPSYRLDINGDSRTGWHGNSSAIPILPQDVRFEKFLDEINGLTNFFPEFRGNGRYIRFKRNAGIISLDIPNGYQATGITLHFKNKPDNVEVYQNFLDGASSQVLLANSTTLVVGENNIALSDPVNSTVTPCFITIVIANDESTGNVFEFYGGQITISRMDL